MSTALGPWLFGIAALLSASAASVMSKMRWAGILAWFSQMALGGAFLSLGSERLALVQWIMASLIGISFLVYSVLFGGVHAEDPDYQRLLPAALFLLSVFIFSSVVYVGMDFPLRSFSVQEYGVEKLGLSMISDHSVPLLLVGLSVFLVTIGIGVIGRAERGSE